MPTAGAMAQRDLKPSGSAAAADIPARDPLARDQDNTPPASTTASSHTPSGPSAPPAGAPARAHSTSSTHSNGSRPPPPSFSSSTTTGPYMQPTSSSYSGESGSHNQQQQQHLPGPTLPAYGPYGSYQQAAAAAGTHAVDRSPTALQQGSFFDESSGSPLPEAAPAPKTDPLELSLLASYLEIVRQTQGEAAAAEAMAASGLPQGTAAAAAMSPFHGDEPQQQHSTASSGPSSFSAGGAGAPAAFDPQRRGSSSSGVKGLDAAAAAEEQLAVNNLLGFIKQRKLAGVGQPPSSSHGRRSSNGSVGSASSVTGSSAGPAGAGGAAAARKVWIQPSGPRRPGEGVENEEQGILSAEEVPATGEVMMRITLLAAGFVIGPSGASVREVVRLSGADINSWTEAAGSHRGRRPARIFVIKGEPRCVAQAIYIVTAAVDRYKELCEGRYTGQSVPRAQNVLGVTFSYQPPPKSIVPYAASLKELYAPPHTVANSAKYGSPPGLFGTNRRAAAAGGFPGGSGAARGGPHPYDPHTWTAMMTAAAAMGMNPLAALAAAAGNPAPAAAGFNPYAAFGAFNPAAMNMLGGGFFGQNPMAGFGQNPVGGGLADPAMSLNPMAGFGMSPMLGGAGLMGGAGDGGMFGAAGRLFDGSAAGGVAAAGGDAGGLAGSGMEGAAEGAAGFAGAWGAAPGPFMFDPTSMGLLGATGLVGGGFGGPAGTLDPAAAAAAGPGGYGAIMAAMASAAAFDPRMLGAADDPAAAAAAGGGMGGYGMLLNPAGPIAGPIAGEHAAESSPAAPHGGAASKRQAGSTGSKGGSARAPADESAAGDSTAAAARAGSGAYEVGGDTVTPRQHAATDAGSSGGRGGDSSSAGRPPSGAAAAAAWPAAMAPLANAYYPRGHMPPPLMIPTADAGPATDPAAAAAAPGSPPPGAIMSPGGMPYPPASPAAPMLGPFGPLFPPMSPGGPYMHPYGPPVAMSPYGPVPASPFRIMRDKSGAAVPYVEMGGTVYFAPASPMPPHAASTLPPASDFASPPGEAGAAGRPAEGQPDAGDSPDVPGSSSSRAARGDSAGRQRANSARSSSGGSRPQSGHAPLRMANAALRLLEDNPYLVQDAIGSGHGNQQQRTSPAAGGQQQQQQRSNGGGGYGSAKQHYGKGSGSTMRSPARRGYAASPNQWRVKPGSSPSGGSSGAGADGAADWDVGDGGRAAAVHRRVGNGSSSAAGAGTAVNEGGSVEGPKFDADAITAALKLPGSGGNSSSSSMKDNAGNAVADSSDSRDDQAGDPAANAAAGGVVSGMDVRPPSMTLLSTIPEASSAASSPAAAALDTSSTCGRPGRPLQHLHQLNAQDPIVSPGRITLASKVKAARLRTLSAAQAAATAAASGGGTGSPTAACE